MTAVRSYGSTFSGFRSSPLPVLPIGEWELKAEKTDCFMFLVLFCFVFLFMQALSYYNNWSPFSLRLTLGRLSRFCCGS